jgi:internalin A
MRRHFSFRHHALLWAVFSFAVALPAAEVIPGGDAQWIEDAGGAVVRDSTGRITGVDLHASWVTDTDMRKLTKLSYLTHLDLSLTRITDQGMQELRNLPGIVDLNLRFAEYVTDEGLAAIKGWKRLKRLDVHGTKISDTTLEHISGITSLEELNIGSAMITDVGLERLSSLPTLKMLTMGGNELGDAGLQALRQLPGLTYLDLSGRQGTDSNVWAIAMSDTGLEAILTLKQLRDLRFGCTFIGVGVEGNRFATVSAINITTRWLERIEMLPKLERLAVQGCQKVDDESLAVLASFPALRELDLKGTSVTDKGVAMFKAAKPKAVVYTGPWEGKAAAFRNN